MQRIIELYLHISEDDFSRKSSLLLHSLCNVASIAQINSYICLLNILKATCKVSWPISPKNPKAESAGFIMAGKLLTGKNMADLSQIRHFFPAIIIPSKLYLYFFLDVFICQLEKIGME